MSSATSSVHLGAATVGRLHPTISVPAYDRGALRPSIVHIGVGGFHRSHLATYIDELCGQGRTDWSIVGAGVLAGDQLMAEVLRSQDHLYSLITRGPEHTGVEIIGSLVGYIHAAPDPDALVAAIAEPVTQIVSLTVTEGGYPIDDVTGEYRAEASSAGVDGAFAAIAAGLARRRQLGEGGLTVISCDNIVSNGVAARSSTVGTAARTSAELASWIETNVAFPNSMVDRITPATTDADRRWLRDTFGLVDGWPVVAEPFRQWALEDTFGADRLPLEDLDVIVTNDVEPYELMKLRLLNAGHSCLAYLAAGLGIGTVDAAMADRDLRGFVTGFFDHEAKPALPAVAGVDLDDYIASIVERFSNPEIEDQIARLCLDGSAKFPKFLLPTIRRHLETGGSVALGALALAGWCDYLTGPDRSPDLQLSPDPLLAIAVFHARRAVSDPRAFLDFSEVFGPDLPRSPRFVEAFTDALNLVRFRGIRSAIDATMQEVRRTHDRSSG